MYEVYGGDSQIYRSTRCCRNVKHIGTDCHFCFDIRCNLKHFWNGLPELLRCEFQKFCQK